MSQSTTLILLPQTVFSGIVGQTTSVTGTTQNAASYYISNKDLQTAAIKLSGVNGNVFIEASLLAAPTESDWFKVYELQANLQANTNSTVSTYTNLVGNFTKIRAKVEDFTAGTIEYIKVSY